MVRPESRVLLAGARTVLRGWGNYFRTGTCSRELLKMDSFGYARGSRAGYTGGAGQRATRRIRWTAEQFHGMVLYRLRGTVHHPRKPHQ
jgi:RNA-directed DNA polymerase